MAKRAKQPDLSVNTRVMKTYKMYVGGNFPRTESGRYYCPKANGESLGNICLASRKDLRNAVVAARAVQAQWSSRSAYNRGQILYRIAEMLEGRKQQFVEEMLLQQMSLSQAEFEIQTAIDRCVVYAGWADKYQQVFSCVNPVASGHFNFSILEPVGVVFVVANENSPLLGLMSLIAPVIIAGNSCVVLASESRPTSAITLAEVLNSSDVPGGVVNILTGRLDELAQHIAKHMDINAIAFDRSDSKELMSIKAASAENLKRVSVLTCDWNKPENANPYLIERFSEVKTIWHPVEKIGPAGSGY